MSDVARPRHLYQVAALRKALILFSDAHPDCIHVIAAGSDCKLLIGEFESERHPDLSIYKTPPPSGGNEAWRTWVPELVIEVVSPSSANRDYNEKPDEYLALGVREYWIVDAEKEEVLVLQRVGSRWKPRVIRPGEIHRTKLLPGFEFDCSPVFEAAKAVPE